MDVWVGGSDIRKYSHLSFNLGLSLAICPPFSPLTSVQVFNLESVKVQCKRVFWDQYIFQRKWKEWISGLLCIFLAEDAKITNGYLPLWNQSDCTVTKM